MKICEERDGLRRELQFCQDPFLLKESHCSMDSALRELESMYGLFLIQSTNVQNTGLNHEVVILGYPAILFCVGECLVYNFRY